jgi:hypothetical protein
VAACRRIDPAIAGCHRPHSARHSDRLHT